MSKRGIVHRLVKIPPQFKLFGAVLIKIPHWTPPKARGVKKMHINIPNDSKRRHVLKIVAAANTRRYFVTKERASPNQNA